MALTKLQLRSLDPNPSLIFSVGCGAREGMMLPQTPNTYVTPSGTQVVRSPRILEIGGGSISFIYKEHLAAAPNQVRVQLSTLVTQGHIEVYDTSVPGAMTPEQIMALHQ